MPKMRANGRSKGCQFVMLRYDMMDSAAWRGLSPHAQALWLHITRRYYGGNNGEIALSCREAAEKLNCSKDRAADAFKELLDAGFIKVGQDSHFGFKMKTSRRWILTHHVFDDQPPTNDWREKSKAQSANSPLTSA